MKLTDLIFFDDGGPEPDGTTIRLAPFEIPGLDRCGYRLHTANAVYKAEPTGVSGYIMTGRRYATIDDCIDNLRQK